MASFGSDEQREIDPTQQVSRDRADAALTLAERLLDKGNSVFQVTIAQMYVMLKFGSEQQALAGLGELVTTSDMSYS